jgi:hypothetical protein
MYAYEYNGLQFITLGFTYVDLGSGDKDCPTTLCNA